MEHSRSKTAVKDRIPFHHKVIYGIGNFVNTLLNAAFTMMTIVLNLGLGMNPALVGLLGAIPRALDAITDPLMGYISDKTKSRWGRRRPYIFIGAIVVGLVYMLLWQLPEGQTEDYYFWYFLIVCLLFYIAYTIYATPFVALGFELTPDYHERTRVMATSNFFGQFAWLIAPWFLWFMQNENFFDSMREGAGWLAIIIGVFVIACGILPAIFLKERFANKPEETPMVKVEVAEQPSKPKMGLLDSIKDFLTGFFITLKCKPFLMLCMATFLVFNGYMMVSVFQNYVIIYYIFAGNTDAGAEWAGWAGSVAAVATFCVIFIVTRLSTLFGKRKAFFIAIGLSLIGYASKWFLYQPETPLLMLLPPILISFGMGSLFTLILSMLADVCDLDELETGERREGLFGSIFWWVVKLGIAVAMAAGGLLLNATGFDIELGANQSEQTILLMRISDILVPLITSALAIWVISKYPITEQKAIEIREQLEQQRTA